MWQKLWKLVGSSWQSYFNNQQLTFLVTLYNVMLHAYSMLQTYFCANWTPSCYRPIGFPVSTLYKKAELSRRRPRCAPYGCRKKFRESLTTLTATFPEIFNGLFFEVCSFTRSWDNSDWSFGRGLRTPNLGEEEAVGGRGWYRSKERWWVPIGPP